MIPDIKQILLDRAEQAGEPPPPEGLLAALDNATSPSMVREILDRYGYSSEVINEIISQVQHFWNDTLRKPSSVAMAAANLPSLSLANLFSNRGEAVEFFSQHGIDITDAGAVNQLIAKSWSSLDLPELSAAGAPQGIPQGMSTLDLLFDPNSDTGSLAARALIAEVFDTVEEAGNWLSSHNTPDVELIQAGFLTPEVATEAVQEALVEGEELPFGQTITDVLVYNVSRDEQIGFGHVVGFGNRTNGNPAIWIPDLDSIDVIPGIKPENNPYENGVVFEIGIAISDPQTGKYLWLDKDGNPEREGVGPSYTFQAGLFFQDSTEEQINQYLETENLKLQDEDLAALEEEGEDTTGLGGFDYNRIIADSKLLGGTSEYLGARQGEPTPVLYNARTGKRVRVQRPEGDDRFLKPGPLGEKLDSGEYGKTYQYIGDRKLIEPHWRQEDVLTFFDGMPGEEVEYWQKLFVRAGILREDAVGTLRDYDISDPTYIALSTAMAYSNDAGLYDEDLIKDSRETIVLAANALSTQKPPMPTYRPTSVEVMPSDAELWETVQDYARQRIGKPLSDNQVQSFISYLQDQYQRSYNVQNEIAERTYYADLYARGELRSEDWHKVSAGGNQFQNVDPEAEFRRQFDQRFGREIAQQERSLENYDTSKFMSMLGTVASSMRKGGLP